MMFSVIFFIILGINHVICDTYNSRVHQQNVRFVREIYKYNHPPTAENDESIPVAVVYDEENNNNHDREGKTINISKETKLPEKQPSAEVDEKVTISTNDSNRNIQPANDKKEEKLKETPRTTEEALHIPVAVVYETEPKTERTQRNYKTNDKAPNQVSRRGQRRPQYQTTETNKSQIKVQNIKNAVSESPVSKKESNDSENQPRTTDYKENQNDTSVSQKENSNDQTRTKSMKRTRERDPVIPIIEMENHVYSHTGEFKYSYEGGDGTKAFEKGELKSFDDDKTGEAVVGGFSYKDKDGNDFSLSYTADENGYRPVGAHLPTPPPIPPAIARALKYLATKTTPEEDIATERTKKSKD